MSVRRKATAFIALVTVLIISQHNLCAQEKLDANIVGHVVSGEEHIPYATVSIKGTTMGTATDHTGHYNLINVPTGNITVIARAVGYKAKEIGISIEANETREIKFELEEDMLELDQVVVTADRNNIGKKEATTLVTALTPKVFTNTESSNISGGLNFVPGLRTENNCQNCGFSQLRMNGLEGPYSEILINGRSIFSGLAGVYGLELIPSNMIERIEVIRGGGSAVYGSNAIAGTVNLVMKDPIYDSYEFGVSQGMIGTGMDEAAGPASDFNLKLNSSLVSSDSKTGMSFYSYYGNRKHFDANHDSFSELPELKNTTMGSRFFHRFGYRNKLIADFFHINEERRGGDNFDSPPHHANIGEALDHDISTGALSYEQFLRESDMITVFASTQYIDRDSYFGADSSEAGYSTTKNLAYNTGINYKMELNSSNLVAGLEWNGEKLEDTRLGYSDMPPGIRTDQEIYTAVAFFQYEYILNSLKLSAGLRYDNYQIHDAISVSGNNKGNVLSPRINLHYDIKDITQLRISYSHGYRAPQLYDEDLHIEASGAGYVIHRNDPGLEQESSRSLLASVTTDSRIAGMRMNLLAEAFYTSLENSFVHTHNYSATGDTLIYTRENAEKGSYVYGINTELNLIPFSSLSVSAGFTYQKNEYREAQDFGKTSFLRSPSAYGYLRADWDLPAKSRLSMNGTYTGSMLVPYFGPVTDPSSGELRTSGTFFDLGAKISKFVKLNGATMEVYAGAKNIFNSYQTDFDRGINKDPAYIYGPALPRTIYFGIRIGNSVFDVPPPKKWFGTK